jgi:transposase
MAAAAGRQQQGGSSRAAAAGRQQQGGRLRLFLLPGYSPELNPDELVWNGLKNHALGKVTHTDKATMRKAAEGYLRSLQRSPQRIKALFQKPSVRYAAA